MSKKRDLDAGLSSVVRQVQIPLELKEYANTRYQELGFHSRAEFWRDLTAALLEHRVFVLPKHVMAGVMRDVEERMELVAREVARAECRDYLYREGFTPTVYEK